MSTPTPSALRRLGRFCYRRHWRVIIAWVVAIVVIGGISGGAGTGYSDSFGDFKSESTSGFDLIEKGFTPPAQENADDDDKATGAATATISFEVGPDVADGVNDPAIKKEMSAFFARVAKAGGDRPISVTSPYDNPQQIATKGDLAGRVAYANIVLPDDTQQAEAQEWSDKIREDMPKAEGLEHVYLGGQYFAEFEAPSSEVLGIGFAIVILIIAFGSVLAMGLPIGMALAGIAVGISTVGIVSNFIGMPEFTTTVAVMIGLGVGIDYALFIVTRFREDLHKGMEGEAAAGHALDTAGRAVIFAGVTVIISVLGMLVMGLEFIQGIGIGCAIAVVFTLLASITLLPALLGLAGSRLEVTRRRGLIAAGLVALGMVSLGFGAPTPVAFSLFLLGILVVLVGLFLPVLKVPLPPRKQKPPRETFWYRYSRFIQHHAWLSAVGGLLFLVILAVPVLSIRLGFSDEGNSPKGSDTKESYDLLADAFGPGFNGPLILVADLPDGTTDAQLAAITARIGETDGVADVAGFSPDLPSEATAGFVNEDRTVARWIATPSTAPQDEATESLVKDLRGPALAPVTDGTGIDVLVTSFTATGIDFSSYLGSRYPAFFGAVLGLSFILLMAVFRSLLVPLKAVIVNLLSIGAAYGVVVAIFQWGWMSGLTGIQPAPIEPFIPMMLFAIVFGLSMDYEVFLLSRMKEEYDRTGNNAEAVADGLAVTARVITAAALIMVVVFGSFLLENNRVIKLMGTGLAVAVLLDATIVRMLAVPATMELLGDRNWWLPKWLDKVLPVIHVEGAPEDADEPDAVDDSELVGAGQA
ncbi:MMPL family transporter [soil metagenome]